MSVAFALVILSLGAALIWLGWKGKSWADLWGDLRRVFAPKGG